LNASYPTFSATVNQQPLIYAEWQIGAVIGQCSVEGWVMDFIDMEIGFDEAIYAFEK
jgi:hypothetical protein